MLETALDIPAAQTASSETEARAPQQKSRRSFYGYTFLLAALCVGWLIKDRGLIRPEDGVGYWLGIIGGSLMLFLLLYPAGKKSALLRRLGLVKHWFRVHMIFGLVGPLLILYHSNFKVDAMNSKVAFYSMLAVAISGVIGKHFYARIHRGLYGKRAGIEELRTEISESLENSRGLAAILPGFIKELHTISAELLGDQFTRSLGFRKSLSWTFKYYVIRTRLYFSIRRELRARAVISETVRANTNGLRKAADAYAAKQVRLMRQVAQISFYEKLFSLWHVFHMPLFLVLVISALVHVLAVHMY
ncbi:MAG: hypothetical protein WBM76_00945 [Woeseiaceae bacterium]